MSDPVAFQEIDDAVRQDELKEWWQRWGSWVVAAAVLAVVVVAGTVGWRQYDASQRAAAGAAYSAALAKIGTDLSAARTELDTQAKDAPEPYRSLAALTAAQLRDTVDQQVTALQDVAPRLPTELSELALVIAAFRGADSARADELVAKLEPLAGPERPFRVSVRELQALAAQRKGDLKRAREIWEEIAKDRLAPPGAQQRTAAMLSLYGQTNGKP